MAKKQLREDIDKISKMMGYDRGLTSIENNVLFEEKLLQEQQSRIIPFENYRDINVSWDEDDNGNQIISDDSALIGIAAGLEDATDTPIDDEDLNDVYNAVTFLKGKFTADRENACEKVLEYFADKTGNEDLEQNVLKAGMYKGFSALGWSDDDNMKLKGKSMTYGAAKRLVAKAVKACTTGSMTSGREKNQEELQKQWPKKYRCVVPSMFRTFTGQKEGKFMKTKKGSIVYIVKVDSKTAAASGGNLNKNDKIVYYTNGTMRIYPRGKSDLASSKGPFPYSCNRSKDMEFEASVEKTDVEVSEVWGENAHEYRRHDVDGVEKRAGDVKSRALAVTGDAEKKMKAADIAGAAEKIGKKSAKLKDKAAADVKRTSSPAYRKVEKARAAHDAAMREYEKAQRLASYGPEYKKKAEAAGKKAEKAQKRWQAAEAALGR